MKRSGALRLNSSLQVLQISSQGTFLSDRRRVWLRTHLFGREKISKKHSPTFPIIFNETYDLERTFTNAHNLASLADILTVEVILIDLVQYSDKTKSGRVLAHYESTVQDFLFPNAKRTVGGIQFVPMEKSKKIKYPIHLSYSSQTQVQEVPLGRSPTRVLQESPTQDQDNDDMLNSERHLRPPPAFHSTPKRLDQTAKVKSADSSRGAALGSSSGRQLEPHPVTRTGLWAYVKNPSEVGLAKRPRVTFVVDDSARLSETPRPPFVVRRVDSHWLDQSGASCRATTSTQNAVTPNNSMAINCTLPDVTVIRHPDEGGGGGGGGLDARTQSTQTPLKTIPGESYGDMRDGDPLARSEIDSTTSSSASVHSVYDVSAGRSLPFSSMAEITGSTQRRRQCNRVKFALDPAQRIHSKIEDLLKTCCCCSIKDDDDSLSDEELELTNTLRNSVAKRLKKAQQSPEKDITIHLGDKDYWSTRMREYTGKPHRLLFDETLEKAYKRLYERAIRLD